MLRLMMAFSLTTFMLFAFACSPQSNGANGKVIKSAPVGNLTVTLANDTGQLKHGGDQFTLAFTDASGKPVEVSAVALTFHMPAMGSMPVMNDQATFTTTGTPGVYHGKANIEMAGEWQAQITYEGPAGRGQTSFSVTAQ